MMPFKMDCSQKKPCCFEEAQKGQEEEDVALFKGLDLRGWGCVGALGRALL